MDTIIEIVRFMYGVLMPPRDETGPKAYWWRVRLALTTASTLVVLVAFITFSFGFIPIFGFSGFASEEEVDKNTSQLVTVRAEIIQGQIWDLNQKQCDLKGNIPAQYAIAQMVAEKQEKFRYLKGFYAAVIPCTP